MKSFRTKFVLAFVLFTVAMAAFVALYFPERHHALSQKAMEAEAQSVAKIFADAAAPALDFFEEDDSALQRILAIADNHPDIAYIRPMTPEGEERPGLRVSASQGFSFDTRAGAQTKYRGKLLHILVPARISVSEDLAIEGLSPPPSVPDSEQRTLGFLQIGFSLERIEGQLHEDQIVSLMVGLALIAVGLVVALVFGKILVSPLEALTKTTRRFGEGAMEVRSTVKSHDEAGRLAEAFNEMADRIVTANTSLKEAREYVEKLLQAMTDLLIVVNPEGTIRRVNRAASEELGYGMDELTGMNLESLVINDGDVVETAGSKGFCNPGMQRLMHEGAVRDLSIVFRTKNGAVLPASLNGSVIHDAAGEVDSIVCVARDMTEVEKRRRAEAAALRAEQEKAQELASAYAELEATHEKLKEAQKMLVDTSRQAGRYEVAVGVLHNVGNVLNSVNTSVDTLRKFTSRSRISGLKKTNALLDQRRDDIGAFLSGDEKGKLILPYLKKLGSQLDLEQQQVLGEISELQEHVNHVKTIIAKQQQYAKVVGIVETYAVDQLIEDALSLTEPSFHRHRIKVVRDFEGLMNVLIDRHRALQVLVNLMKNAKQALIDSDVAERRLTVRVRKHGGDRFRIWVDDNGVGINAENLTKVFVHGFTTKKNGHGFGLHTSALTAEDMGGSLTCTSDGAGKGTSFCLELPTTHTERRADTDEEQ